MSQEQDRYLVKALLSGDTDAWNEISLFIERMLKNVSRRHYIPDDDISDLRQDVLTKLIEDNYRRLHGFSFRCRLSTWVGSIVNNHLFDHYRSEIRRERRNKGFEDFRKDMAIDTKNDEEMMARISDMEKLEEAIESLTPAERRAVRMTYWDDLRPTEISKITGERVSTISSRIVRARIRLREILAPLASDESQKAI